MGPTGQVTSNFGFASADNFLMDLHCKYIRPNYDGITAYHRTTTTIHWFQPLVVGCQIGFIVDIAINESI